jgi:hypothetical protein
MHLPIHAAYHVGAQVRVRPDRGGLLYAKEIGTVTQIVETTTHYYYMLTFAHRAAAVFRDDELDPMSTRTQWPPAPSPGAPTL